MNEIALFTYETRQRIAKANLLPGKVGFNNNGFFIDDREVTDEAAFELIATAHQEAAGRNDMLEVLLGQILEAADHGQFSVLNLTPRIDLHRKDLERRRKLAGRELPK